MSPRLVFPLLLPLLTLTACSDGGDVSWDFDTETASDTTAAKPQLFEVPYGGEKRIAADLDIGLGEVRLGRAAQGQLVQAEIALAKAGLEPSFSYSQEGDGGRLDIGLAGEGSLRGGKNRWDIRLTDAIPLALDVELGMSSAQLDLSGFRLTALSVEAGMAEATVRFDRPNAEALDAIDLSAGMAEFKALGLGHARFRRLHFEGGAGRFVLDFRGDAPVPGAVAELELGMASAEVVLPAGRPVIIEAEESWGSEIDVPIGFVKRGEGVWHSPEAGSPAEALTVRAEVGAGSVRFRVE